MGEGTVRPAGRQAWQAGPQPSPRAGPIFCLTPPRPGLETHRPASKDKGRRKPTGGGGTGGPALAILAVPMWASEVEGWLAAEVREVVGTGRCELQGKVHAESGASRRLRPNQRLPLPHHGPRPQAWPRWASSP